jgi:hypothetical protein
MNDEELHTLLDERAENLVGLSSPPGRYRHPTRSTDGRRMTDR